MKPSRIRIVSRQPARARRLRLYALLRRGTDLYPHNDGLRKKWIRARLVLGKTQPKVKVGLEQRAMFPRTTAEAAPRNNFTALAPRTMRDAGLKS